MINCWRNEQPTSTTRLDLNLIPMKESFKKATTNCDHRRSKVAKYDYKQIEKEFASDSFLRKIPSVTINPKIINESTKEQRKNDRKFLKHLIGSSMYYSNHQWKQSRSTPNYRKVPEQLYHLYETQDAFGNLMELL